MRRRPRASQTARAAKQRVATSQSQFARAGGSGRPVCAVSSWSELTIAILPVDSGSCSAILPMIATCSPSSMMIGRRSSTTSPPVVETNSPSSSRSSTSCRCVAVATRTHASCRRGRSSSRFAASSAPCRAMPASTGASAFCSSGRRSASAGFDVDVRVELLDGRPRHLLADLVGADQLGRDRLEPVLVEDRPLEVERDRADEEEDERDDGEDSRRDRASLARRRRTRGHGA